MTLARHDSSAGSDGRPDKRHYLRGFLWSSGSTIVVTCASTITMMVAVRVISQPEMGAFFLVLLVGQCAQIIGDFGQRQSTVMLLGGVAGEARDELRDYLLTVRYTATSVTACGLAVLLPVLYRVWPTAEFRAVAWFCVPTVFVMMLHDMGITVSAGYLRFRQASTNASIVEIARAVLSLCGLAAGLGLHALLYSLLLSRFLGVLLSCRQRTLRFVFRWRHPQERAVFAAGGWLQAASVLSVINARVLEAILTRFLGTTALAVYSTGMQVPGLLQRTFDSIRPVMITYVASLKLAAAQASVNTVRLLGGLCAMGAGLLVVLSEPLTILLYSRRYIESAVIMQILLGWCVFAVVNYCLVVTLIGMNRPRPTFFLNIPPFVMGVVGTLVLLPRYQGVGVAIALLLSAFVSNFLWALAIAWPDRRLAMKVVAALLRSAIPLLILMMLTVWLAIPMLLKVLCYAGMIGALFALKAVTPRDIRMLWQALLRKPQAGDEPRRPEDPSPRTVTGMAREPGPLT